MFDSFSDAFKEQTELLAYMYAINEGITNLHQTKPGLLFPQAKAVWN